MLRFVTGILVVWGLCVSGVQAQYYARIKIDLNEYLLSGSTGTGLGTPTEVGSSGCCCGFPVEPTPTPMKTEPEPKSTAEPYWLVGHLAVSKREPYRAPQGDPYWIVHHKWGKTFVPYDDIKIVSFDSIISRFRDKRDEFDTGGKTIPELLHLAEFALQRGLTREFLETMDEMVKKEANHPVSRAFQKVHKKLQSSVQGVDPGAQAVVEEWRASGYDEVPSKSGHYVLLTKLRRHDPAVKDRLDYLEKTYANYFYWFVLQAEHIPAGQFPEPPDYRLVVVLESDTNDYKRKHRNWAARSMMEDGFTVRQANVIFLSVEPLSEKYIILDRNNQADWKRMKTNPRDMLEGKNPPVPVTNLKDIPKLQTRSLMQKIMEADSELAATSHEGICQLLAATDLLPRNVVAVEWFRHGLASFFETPREAFFPSTALPSWTNLIEFQYLTKKGRLSSEQADMVALKTLTDYYYRQAHEAFQKAKTKKKRDQAQAQMRLAECTSWAFTYYLMNNRLKNVFAYMGELKRLPRDVEYDAPVLAGCFARAFNMAPAEASTDFPINMASLRTLGQKVFTRMELEAVDIRPLHRTILDQRIEKGKQK